MIESSTLAALAESRRLVSILRLTETHAPHRLDGIVLWPEPPTEHTSYTRDDAWRLLTITHAGVPEAGLIFAGEAEIVLEAEPGETFAPVSLDVPIPGGVTRQLVEAALLACHLGLRVGFRYRKDAMAPVEVRRGKALGMRGPILLIEDADRGNATRGFRLDRMDLFQPLDFVPRWDGAAYSVAGA